MSSKALYSFSRESDRWGSPRTREIWEFPRFDSQGSPVRRPRLSLAFSSLTQWAALSLFGSFGLSFPTPLTVFLLQGRLADRYKGHRERLTHDTWLRVVCISVAWLSVACVRVAWISVALHSIAWRIGHSQLGSARTLRGRWESKLSPP
jgi:hypothetical protein